HRVAGNDLQGCQGLASSRQSFESWRRLGIHGEVRLLRPGLHHALRLESGDDRAGSLSVRTWIETGDVIAMTVGRDHGEGVLADRLADVLGNRAEQSCRAAARRCGGAEVDQQMPRLRAPRIPERQQEAVTEA